MREENNIRKRLGERLDWGEELRYLKRLFPDNDADDVTVFSRQAPDRAELNATPDRFDEPWTVSAKEIDPPVPSEIASELDISWSLHLVPRQYEVKLHFINQAAATVGQVHWHPSQQTQAMDDGSLLVIFRIPNPEAMLHWLLRYGNNVTVLSPQWLGHKVRLASEWA